LQWLEEPAVLAKLLGFRLVVILEDVVNLQFLHAFNAEGNFSQPNPTMDSFRFWRA
jgi:hypothetical protein